MSAYVLEEVGPPDYLTQVPQTNIPLYYNWFNGFYPGPIYIPKLYNGKTGPLLFAWRHPTERANRAVPQRAHDTMKRNFAFGRTH